MHNIYNIYIYYIYGDGSFVCVWGFVKNRPRSRKVVGSASTPVWNTISQSAFSLDLDCVGQVPLISESPTIRRLKKTKFVPFC